MENNAIVSKAEQDAIAVSYEVLGTKVNLDIDFVKNYLVRGRGDMVTNQELVMFINTCKAQRLNPLANGEVYLIKYDKDKPAQIVVGKDAYTKRAFLNPNYISKEDGIVVLRGNEVVRKEGCCLYPKEELIGGWCRITYERKGQERKAFREVSLTEYNSGQANWKSKPSTMINKVAIAQCIRDAFPAEYEGLYSEEELVASGAIDIDENGNVVDSDGVVMSEEKVATVEETDRAVTADERRALFALAKEAYGKVQSGDKLKALLAEEGIESTEGMPKSIYDRITAKIEGEVGENENKEDAQQ